MMAALEFFLFFLCFFFGGVLGFLLIMFSFFAHCLVFFFAYLVYLFLILPFFGCFFFFLSWLGLPSGLLKRLALVFVQANHGSRDLE